MSLTFISGKHYRNKESLFCKEGNAANLHPLKTRTSFVLPMVLTLACLIYSCSPQKISNMKGTYSYDKNFFEKHQVDYLELSSPDGLSRVIVVPAWQGRVMTSTAGGEQGNSFGWVNYSFIESGKTDPHIQVYGGEERFWMGPEGGPFSIYFKEGEEQVFDNWKVPPVIDTESFDLAESNETSASFFKSSKIVNASGAEFSMDIRRTVTLLNKKEAEDLLGTNLPENAGMVAYRTGNEIVNTGIEAWTKDKGLVSIWMLCMFNPSSSGVVFIPYDTAAEGLILNDDYFGKVPAERLKVENGMIFFKVDGKHRSKIGLPASRAGNICGSYDPDSNVLTLLWYAKPEKPGDYVNSKWGPQSDPFNGDVINSYNDGPLEDGSMMGPFYEIETSSPGAELNPGEKITHSQAVFHIEGSETDLEPIVNKLFGLSLKNITNAFGN